MRELSRLAGLSESHARLIETSGKDVRLDVACKLADTLGVSIDWLAGRSGAVIPVAGDVLAAVSAARARVIAPPSTPKKRPPTRRARA